MLKFSDFKLGDVIEKTSKYILLQATNEKTNQEVTLKYYRLTDHSSKAYAAILNEVVLMAKCKHQNIIELYGFSEKVATDPLTKEEYIAFYVVMERFDQTLKQMIKTRERTGRRFALLEIQDFVTQLIPAFFYLQNEKISQQDIKPRNILISKNLFKVGDICSGRNLLGSDITYDQNVEGSLTYFSPEKVQSFAECLGKLKSDMVVSDVFSLGLVILRVASLRSVKGLNKGDNLKERINARIQEQEDVYGSSFCELMRMMLNVDAFTRKNFGEILGSDCYRAFLKHWQPVILGERLEQRLSASDFLLCEKKTLGKDEYQKQKSEEMAVPEDLSRGNIKAVPNKNGKLDQIDEIHRESDSDRSPSGSKIDMKEYNSSKSLEQEVNNIISEKHAASKEAVGREPERRSSQSSSNSSSESEKLSDKRIPIPIKNLSSTNVLNTSKGSSLESSPISEIESLIKAAEKARKACQFNKALDLYEESLKIKWQVEKTEDDQQTSDILYGLGHVCIELGNYDKGLDLHLKALKMRIKYCGPMSKSVADSYNSIGVSYHGLGNLEKGLDSFEKALEIYKNIYGEESKEAALGYNNLGGSYSLYGDHQKALNYKLKALNIKIKYLGEDSEDTAWSYDNVGVEYSELDQRDKALEFKLKALECRKRLFGENKPQTAVSYNNIAVEYANMGENLKSLQFHQKALEIRRTMLGENHPETARSYHNIGCCYYSLGDFVKALDNYDKAFKIRKTILGENHKDTQRSFKEAEDLRRRMKK